MSIPKQNISLKQILGTALGALFSGIAIKLFVQAADLVPAGAGGVSVLIIKEAYRLFGITLNYSVLYLILNVMILAFVYKKLGKKFIALSFLHVALTSFFVEIIPAMTLAHDPILLALFGGVVNGLGSSIVLRMNGSAGGTDFVAIYYSMVKNKPMWDKILMFNMAVLVYSGWQYNWELALYSILYQFTSTQIINTYHNRYKLSSLHIITSYPDEVSQAILDVTRHGITKLDGLGVYHQQYKAMLYMVANEFETKIICEAVKKADSKAFIEVGSVSRVEGNYRQKPLE